MKMTFVMLAVSFQSLHVRKRSKPVSLSSTLNFSHEGVSLRTLLFNIPVALSVQLLPEFIMTAVGFPVPRHHVHTCRGPHQPPTKWTSAGHFSCCRATVARG